MRGLIDCVDSPITRPTLEPLDLEEVKKQRRFSPTTLDTLFDLWISAARQHFEETTGRQVLRAVWEYWMDEFPCARELELPHPPLLSVVSIKYDDAAGDEQTMDPGEYRVIAPAGAYAPRGRVGLYSGTTWPTTADHAKAVRIQYAAGYGEAPGDVPELVRASLLFLVGHFHKYNEEVQDAATVRLPLGATLLMDGFKYTALQTLYPLRAPWLD